MSDNVEKDIYLKLMEDLFGTSINPDASIFNAEINEKMINSCNSFAQVLGMEIEAGINGDKFLEPCPIAYTGKLEENNTFDTVFVGLNPYSEGPRDFPSKTADRTDDETDWADLANMHHPNDVWYKRSVNRYAVSKKNIDAGIMRNNYWRVFGHKETTKKGDSKWSRYYIYSFPIHVFLHLKTIKETLPIDSFSLWGEFSKNTKQKTTDVVLEILEKFPIANIEAIPYKSETFTSNDFKKLFEDERTKKQYIKYMEDSFKFIYQYSKPDAYIIITAGKDDIEKGIVTDEFIKLMNRTSSHPIHNVVKGAFCKEQLSFKKDAMSKSYERAPLHLFRWDNHKVIVTTPISSARPNYSWIYTSIPKEFVKEISDDRNYK